MLTAHTAATPHVLRSTLDSASAIGNASQLDDRRQQVFLLHIPKVAGQSLHNDVRQYLASHVRFLDGAWAVRHERSETCLPAVTRDFPTLALRVVTLRSPRHHVASMFAHCRDHWAARQLMRPYTGHFLRTIGGKNASRVDGLAGWLRHHRSIDHSQNRTMAQHAVASFRCFDPHDMQTRALTCDRECEYASHRGAVGSAQQALRHALSPGVSLGVVELYRASFCALLFRVTGTLHPGCGCGRNASAPQNPIGLAREMHGLPETAVALPVRSLPQHLLEDIDNLTARDRHVYAAAARRAVKGMREVEARSGTRIVCADEVEALEREVGSYLPEIGELVSGLKP